MSDDIASRKAKWRKQVVECFINGDDPGYQEAVISLRKILEEEGVKLKTSISGLRVKGFKYKRRKSKIDKKS